MYSLHPIGRSAIDSTVIKWFAAATYAAGLALVLYAANPAYAQTEAYPNKPITLIVAYPPGGSTDLTGRVVAEQLSKRLNNPVVVENVGGAGGGVGAQKLVSAKPDGYTLMLGANNELVVKKLISPSTKYDASDFTAIGLVASQPMVFVAGKKAGVNTLNEFIDKAKTNPGKFSYGSSGVGTVLHLSAELLKRDAGIFMTHIPYRGVGPLTSDLLGENIEYGVYVLSSALPHIRSGKLVALGTTEKQRSPLTPTVPALSEHPKLKSVETSAWFALVGPAKLPDAVVQKLRQALNDALQAPELRKKLEESGASVAAPNTDAAAVIAADTAKFKKVVEFAKITEE